MGLFSTVAKVGVCVIFPPAAPAIVFSEVAARAVGVAMRTDGGDEDDAKEAERTARGILGAASLGSLIDRGS